MTIQNESDQNMPAPGTLAEEAAQLLDVFAVKLADLRLAVGARPAARDAVGPGAPGHTGPPPENAPAGHGTCVGWCPICRSAELLRGDRPEVAEKLVDTALLVVATLRSLIPAPAAGSPAPAAAGSPEPAAAGSPEPATAGPPESAANDEPDADRPGIQRIDIA